MIPAPRIELATLEDVAELAEIRAEQGWHPNTALLRAMLTWEGCRVFVLREPPSPTTETNARGRLLATTCALVAETVGSIGSVAVRPQYQRRGLGRRLMEAALAWQRERGARSVLLDATVEGRPLYRRLGFVPIGARSWFASARATDLNHATLLARAGGVRASLLPASQLGRVAALDLAAFGGDRLGLLAQVLAASEAWCYLVEDAAGLPLGYLIARLVEGGHPLLRIGSWVARSPMAAAALLAALLDPAAPWRVRIPTASAAGAPLLTVPIPGYGADALMLWTAAGGTVEIDDLIMQLDFADESITTDVAPPTQPPRAFAAHPAWTYAWLNPMTL